MVRASLRMRWKARAESCSWLIAARTRLRPASSNLQCAHVGVGVDAGGRGEMLALNPPRLLHSGPDRLRPFAQARVRQLEMIDSRHFDVDVDAVEQRAADPFLVASDNGGSTGAFFDWVSMPAARAWMITKHTLYTMA